MIVRGKTGVDAVVRDFRFEGGLVRSVEDAAGPLAAGGLGGDELYVAPGFIDLQLNGYGGVDFNDAATSPERIAGVAKLAAKTGVTTFFPTVITGSFDHIAQCLKNLVRARGESPAFAYAAPAFHLEGPFISAEDGPRGAHPRAHARPPDWDEFRRWQDVAEGLIRIVTL